MSAAVHRLLLTEQLVPDRKTIAMAVVINNLLKTCILIVFSFGRRYAVTPLRRYAVTPLRPKGPSVAATKHTQSVIIPQRHCKKLKGAQEIRVPLGLGVIP